LGNKDATSCNGSAVIWENKPRFLNWNFSPIMEGGGNNVT